MLDHRSPAPDAVGGLPSAPSARCIAVAAVALTGAWCGAALLRFAHADPTRIDRAWDALVSSTSSRIAHGVAGRLAVLGKGPPATALVLVTGALVGVTRGWRWGVFVGAACLISLPDRAGLKALARRERPDAAYGVLDAFPSGHTTFAALLGTLVILLDRRVPIRGAAIVFIATMAWSRTQLRAHWLTDVLGAIVTGSAEAVLLLAAAHRLGESSTRWRRTAEPTPGAPRRDRRRPRPTGPDGLTPGGFPRADGSGRPGAWPRP